MNVTIPTTVEVSSFPGYELAEHVVTVARGGKYAVCTADREQREKDLFALSDEFIAFEQGIYAYHQSHDEIEHRRGDGRNRAYKVVEL